MHKWSLEDLPLDDVRDPEPSPHTRYFIEDNPEDGARTLLDRLTPEERMAVYELVAEDVRGEIRAEIHAEFGQELELMRGAMIPLARRLEETVTRELHEIAVGAVGLAVALGERLARTSIDCDDTYLVRCLEELVGRTQTGSSLEVVAHPAEIERLDCCRDELAGLNVTALVPDRSLPPGGCLVRAAGQEWDLTFRGQADALAEMVQNAVTYGGACTTDPHGEEPA